MRSVSRPWGQRSSLRTTSFRPDQVASTAQTLSELIEKIAPQLQNLTQIDAQPALVDGPAPAKTELILLIEGFIQGFCLAEAVGHLQQQVRRLPFSSRGFACFARWCQWSSLVFAATAPHLNFYRVNRRNRVIRGGVKA